MKSTLNNPREESACPALLAVILVVVPSLALAQSASKDAIERGRKQFVQSCGFCHGADATGARGPDLVRSALVAHDVNGNLIGEVIRSGRPDKGMPPLPLTAPQIADVAVYLHARAKQALNSGDVPRSYPLSKLLTGNAERGKVYFNGEGGCSGCHSPTGDLAHVARKYPPIDLEARMLYPEGAPSSAVVTLTSGEEVKGRVVHLDDFSIGLRDASGWYRSFSRDKVTVDVHDPLAAHRKLLNKLSQNDIHNLFTYLETLK